MKKFQGLMATLAPLSLALWLSGCCCGDAAEMLQSGIELAETMQNAPGAEELRAAGCSEAMVMSPEAIKGFAEAMGADKEDMGELESWKEELVICTRGDSLSALDCPKVARVYAGSEGVTSERFGVTVQVEGQEEPACQGIYSDKGERIGELNEESLKVAAPK